MRSSRFVAGSLMALSLCIAAVRAETASPQRLRDPARLLPEQTDWLVAISQPRRLVETLTALDAFKQFQEFAPVREFFDSTNYRRFYQLVAYFEKELDAPWPQLLDHLAGRGVALGIVFQSLHEDNKQFGITPTAVLLVIQGEDEERMSKFFRLGTKVVEQELARQEAKGKLIRGAYEGIDTVRIGATFHAATADGALLLSSTEKMLHAGLDRCLGRAKKSMAKVSSVREAEKQLPSEPLVFSWLNMKNVRKPTGAKTAFQSPPRDDANLTVLVGHYLDLLVRSPFVCAGLYRDEDGFAAHIQTPRGRKGMGLDQLLHLPPPGKPGSRPFLEPKNVLYSESKYLDVSRIWSERDRLFNDKQARALEQFDKKSSPFLIGTKIDKLLTQAGPYYRIVAAHQAKTGYKKTPGISIPAFALVWELREPEKFSKAMETILRGVALLSGAKINLKLAEEKYKGCKLVGYRFPEDKPLKGDTNDLRFNFSPCFTRVGDQFVACSTIELCRELVDILHEEGTKPARGDASPARSHLYAAGIAAYLNTLEDLLVTQTTLDRAATPKEAREQVKRILAWIRRLGTLSLESQFHEETAEYSIRLRAAK